MKSKALRQDSFDRSDRSSCSAATGRASIVGAHGSGNGFLTCNIAPDILSLHRSWEACCGHHRGPILITSKLHVSLCPWSGKGVGAVKVLPCRDVSHE